MVTDRGFYSVVDKGQTEGELCVRARVREDLERLCELEPMAKYAVGIQESEFGDYRCRINVSRKDWEEAARLLAESIDYSNFKDAVKERQGSERARVYMDVWTALYELQRAVRLPRKRQAESDFRQGDIEIMPVGKGGLQGMPPIRIRKNPESSED
ncbi:MAG: hypothetical protein WBW62_08315 [Solirubrobacterales bacterium]